MFISETEKHIVFSNRYARLTLGKDGKAHSLVCLQTGEELLDTDDLCPLFSVTQQRFYNNELKLMHASKRTTRQANSLRLENGKLTVGFVELPYEAVVCVNDCGAYFTFTLEDFICLEDGYGGLLMSKPPVDEFRLLQLPVRKRTAFGAWMNVVSDDKTAACVMAPTPFVRIDAQETENAYILTADAARGLQLKGGTATLFVSANNTLLDKIDAFEKDFDLPLGAQSRRSEFINASVYWTYDANPRNIDEHIAYAKKGGFRLMLFYYIGLIKEEYGYSYNGNYELRDEFPNGLADVRAMLDRVKAAGIIPGIHFLQTHIGMKSRYMTPEADHRVLHRQHLTLSRPLAETDTDIFVDQCPADPELPPECRILRFGKELIQYESCSEEYPYHYSGCKRGYNGTTPCAHEQGSGGGVLWMSEFGATSVYVDQNNDLQDEIADKIAALYNQGFRFIYFDGSEGANPPFENYIPLAQYRVYKKCKPAPLFCEGAAKGHFSWHMLSGGNAFDIFPTEIFKAMLDKFPVYEAPLMWQDHTRLNFGWWEFYPDTQPDTFEYGTSHAAGFDCPATLRGNPEGFATHARTDDILEVMRRWEDVRAKNLLTDAQKKAIRQPQKEHILLYNAQNEYELTACERLQTTENQISAFRFERNGKQCAVLWHNTAAGELFLPVSADAIRYADEIDRAPIAVTPTDGGIVLPVAGRRYMETTLTADELKAAILNAECSVQNKRKDIAPL